MSANKTNQGKAGETAVRVLLYDVESSPNLAYVWGKYEQNALGDFVKERQIISFAWKWLGEKQVHVLALPSFKSYARFPENNRALILKLHALFSQADIIVGHNIDDFDDKMANTDFIKHGLQPPPPHKTVDTLKVARSKFRFNSNKLDDLGAFLKLGRKIKHDGFGLWVRCLAGNNKAWSLMKRYNKNDVTLLERIYLRIRPWMTNHPNMTALDGKEACPTCRSKNIKRSGWLVLQNTKKQRFACKDCGRWFSGSVVQQKWKFK